jgi:hypothetical protein
VGTDPDHPRVHLCSGLGRDCDPECVKRGCDRQPEDERGGAETGRQLVTSVGDRATAVTGVHRRTLALSAQHISTWQTAFIIVVQIQCKVCIIPVMHC